MISSAVCSLVRRNVAIDGGTEAAIALINSSAIGPGPDGILPTNPIADAPKEMACTASSWLEIQQIFILGLTQSILVIKKKASKLLKTL